VRRRAAILVLVVLAPAAWAAVVEWDGTPISVVLGVGIEQQIRFEGPASVGVPAELVDTGALRTLFVNRSAYWTAAMPFDRRRVAVRLAATGEFVLFDVEAVPSGEGGMVSAEPLEVVVARPEKAAGPLAGRRAGVASEPRNAAVGLIRYAAQLDLGPRRLVAGGEGVVAVDTATRDVTSLYRHPDAGWLSLTVGGQWSRAGTYVTAVRVASAAPAPVEFDVRHFQFSADGGWNGAVPGFVAVGSARYELAPAGEAESVTTLYVVTAEPFDAAVRP